MAARPIMEVWCAADFQTAKPIGYHFIVLSNEGRTIRGHPEEERVTECLN
jgi:hypothetical protein